MFKRDGEGAIIGFILIIAIIAAIIWAILQIAKILAIVAAVSGVVYGGGTAIKNYALAFKENIIDSNMDPRTTTV